MNNVDEGGRRLAEGLRKQRRAEAAVRRRAAAKARPPAPPPDAEQVVAVAAEDMARFAELHQQSQTERLRFADMAAQAMQQLAPQLVTMGTANKDVREAIEHLAEKYQIAPKVEGTDAVWELLPSKGGFVRREDVPAETVPTAEVPAADPEPDPDKMHGAGDGQGGSDY